MLRKQLNREDRIGKAVNRVACGAARFDGSFEVEKAKSTGTSPWTSSGARSVQSLVAYLGHGDVCDCFRLTMRLWPSGDVII